MKYINITKVLMFVCYQPLPFHQCGLVPATWLISPGSLSFLSSERQKDVNDSVENGMKLQHECVSGCGLNDKFSRQTYL